MKIWRNEPNIHPRNPSSCTQAVTARLCKMSVDADVDVDASARAKLWCHWAEEAQAPSPQVNSTTSWRWLWRWRSSAGKIMEDLAVWWFCMILRWWETLCNPDFGNDVSDSLCVFGSSLLFPCPLNICNPIGFYLGTVRPPTSWFAACKWWMMPVVPCRLRII